MNVVEGDAYNRALVDRSKNQIRALGFFKDVTIEEIPGSAPDRTALQVKVEEQPTGELSFSAGYSLGRPAGARPRHHQRNFRGRGQNVRARCPSARCASRSTSPSPSRGFLAATWRPVSTSTTSATTCRDYSAYKTRPTGANCASASR
jgi:outer membrane protein insertion porin family